MFIKSLCLSLLLLKLAEARYAFVPKFYGQDSAVIVDTDKLVAPAQTPPVPQQPNKVSLNYPTKLRLPPPPPFPLWQHFPRYHIIPPPPPSQIISINTWPKSRFQAARSTTTTTTTEAPTTTTTTSSTSTTSTTTTTTTTPKPTPKNSNKFKIDTVPFVTDDEFPRELLDIAQNKLGLKSLDEIPSISELGQLLGTSSPHETLEYIRKLTANEQGVALMKAYIESADYTDSSDKDDNDDYDDNEEGETINLRDIEGPLKINDEGLVVINDADSIDDYEMRSEDEVVTTTTAKPRKAPKILKKLNDLKESKPGLWERIAKFMHLNNLWHKNAKQNPEYNEVSRLTIQGKKVEGEKEDLKAQDFSNDNNNNIPVIPYNYPVPLRRETTSTTSTTTTTTTTPAPPPPAVESNVVHLNTPKMLIPHVKQLARVTKIPPKKIEDFLASKPKLLALANKVSRFPIGYDQTSPLESQVMLAVQKAIENDEDLKKLLSSAGTLK